MKVQHTNHTVSFTFKDDESIAIPLAVLYALFIANKDERTRQYITLLQTKLIVSDCNRRAYDRP